MTNDLLNVKIAQLRALEAQMKTLSKQADAIKDSLKAELDELKVDSIDTGIHKIFYQVYEKASVDLDKLKKAGIYNDYLKSSLITQFKITDKRYPA